MPALASLLFLCAYSQLSEHVTAHILRNFKGKHRHRGLQMHNTTGEVRGVQEEEKIMSCVRKMTCYSQGKPNQVSLASQKNQERKQ